MTKTRQQQRYDKDVDNAIVRLKRAIKKAPAKTCPICKYEGQFGPFGIPPRLSAKCPSCWSLERHRLFYLWVEREQPFSKADSLLHFAAEKTVRRFIEPQVGRYVTTDYMRPEADLKLNIEEMELEDACFTRIICNHVLEHVDDRKALSELYRVLVPGGIAVLSTPICEGWAETYENPDIPLGPEAHEHFGQWDHVRFYGRDIRDRIKAAGFDLREVVAVEPDVQTHGLLRGEVMFVANKPA